MRLLRLSILSIFLLLSVSFNALATTTEASNFVSDLANRVITLIKNTQLNESSKEASLNDIFLQAVDTKWIARFAMGRYWRAIDPTQQEQYLDLFSKYLSSIYVPNFRKYTGNIMTVTGVMQVSPQEYIVHTDLTDSAKTMDLKIDYRVIQSDDGVEKFVIFDIVAEGVSLITTQRADVGSIMADGGFTSLVSILNQKTVKQEKN